VTLNARQRQRAMSWMLQQPGIRGVGVPADVYDKIAPVANGIALPMWGRPASLEQIQWLHDNEITEPADIHKAFSALPHPNSPSTTVGEYPSYVHALSVFDEHK
jgi:hypothetical protein